MEIIVPKHEPTLDLFYGGIWWDVNHGWKYIMEPIEDEV